MTTIETAEPTSETTKQKITIELADYEIEWLRRIGQVWKINADTSVDNDSDKEYSVEYVAATLAAEEARDLVRIYNISNPGKYRRPSV